MYKEQAFQVLAKSAVTPGFLATATQEENYGRVWSRDSAITALACFLHEQTQLYPAIKASILTLAAQQKENGLIPSNVGYSSSAEPIVSYGTLVGRVDAQTWWIIQSCLYIKVTNDLELKQQLHTQIDRTLNLLESWEFNARHLVYTPLGGNWADEYILSGYTLYDNALRYLALHLCACLWPENNAYQEKAIAVRAAIAANFSFQESQPKLMIHSRAKSDWIQQQKPYFPAAFDAAQYNSQWDAAANGLALILGFQNEQIVPYVSSLIDQSDIGFVPAFWPVITPADAEWKLLKNQYNYSFKNEPFQFHNGGSWPVMSGVLALGLILQGEQQLVQQIKADYEQFLEGPDELQFSEFISLNHQKPGGKQELCFSASGYLFMCSNAEQIRSLLEL
jgi:hypothetical protein